MKPAGNIDDKDVSRLSLNGKDAAQSLLRVVRTCRGVLKDVVWFQLVRAIHAIYLASYVTGIYTVRLFRRGGRRAGRIFAPVGRFAYKALDYLLLRHARAIGRECRRFGQGFGLAAQRVKAAYRRHPLLAFSQALLLPFLAVRRHRRALFSLFNLAAPVAAAFVLISTVQYWSGLTFALQLEYDGQTLGVIADESVFDSAANMAAMRVINTDDSFAVQRSPKLTVTVAEKADILDDKAVCDRILLSSQDSIAEVSGLYIDGEFEGSVQSREGLDAILNGILAVYKSGAANERAEFIQKVEVVDGLYPISTVVSEADMKARLTAQTVVEKYYEAQKGDSMGRIANLYDMTLNELRAMNPQIKNDTIFVGDKVLVQRPQPYLRVQVVSTIEYTESIAFSTKKVEDAKQYMGYEKVKTAGKNGTRKVVAEVVKVDGVEQSRTVLSTEVVQQPVDKVVVVGAMKYNQTSVIGDGVSTGRFIWPIPSGKQISTWYTHGHGGLDICGGVNGKPIIAADGGRVVEAVSSNNSTGYGYYVIIEHANGYRTLYAHCSKVLVTKGQKVTQGQQIALAGSTGYSTGPHLHFEIRKNGVTVDPYPYIKNSR